VGCYQCYLARLKPVIITATLAGENLIALTGIIGLGAAIIGAGIIGGNATGTAGTTMTKLQSF
jgi:hypothetical protein